MVATALAAPLLLAACMAPTPFGTDVDLHGLNRKNVERLVSTPSSAPLRFVALGDTHDAYDSLLETVESINSRSDIDFVVHVGDSTSLGLLQEFEWTQRALSQLSVPALVTLGNHDAISSGKEVYRNLYGPYDFAFVYKSIKFVFFNSNSLEFAGQAPDRGWLESQLSELDGATSAVLVTHQNPRSLIDGTSNNAEFYESLLRAHAVSLVAHGHLHDFGLVSWLGVPILQCSTFEKSWLYTVVTLEHEQASFELCRFDACVQRAPPEGGS